MLSPTSQPFLFEVVRFYTSFERHGVTWIVSGSLVSLLAILVITVFGRLRNAYPRTHVIAYFVCLLVANTVQSSGTAMSLRWIIKGEIDQDTFCQLQGAVKQFGNVATAVWSFMIALHLFNLLFFRLPTTKLGLFATLSFGWTFIATIVILGPAALQRTEKGFYFGISGNWCWITDGYPREQTYLEYFFELLSAGTSFFLYVLILLRVRGNIVLVDDKWRLKSLPKGESWQLDMGRDILDTAMLKTAKHMVWFPIAYSLILVPISLARLVEFAGGTVPDWAPIVTDVLFNLQGFVNVTIFLATRHFFPDVGLLPEFTIRRKEYSSRIVEAGGLTPFPFSSEWVGQRFGPGPAAQGSAPEQDTSRFSVSSAGSATSSTPLRKPEKALPKWYDVSRWRSS